MKLTVLLLPREHSQESRRFKSVLQKALRDIPHRIISDITQVALPTRLMVALSLGPDGQNPSLFCFLSQLRQQDALLKGCVAGFVVEAESDLYGKSVSSQLAFALNVAGCALVGSPLVEATTTPSELLDTPSGSALSVEDSSVEYEVPHFLQPYTNAVTLLAERILGPGFRGKSPLTGQPNLPKLVAVHSNLDLESNLQDLWEELKLRLTPFISCEEISLRKQSVSECNLCDLDDCPYFRHQNRCIYGTALKEEDMKHIQEADAVLMVSSNYHNGLHPLQAGFIHYLSARFSKDIFFDKALYALIVSSYSGGDMVANQLISTLSLDNSFFLPPRFALLETASQPMEALSQVGIEEKLDKFSHSILETLSIGHLF